MQATKHGGEAACHAKQTNTLLQAAERKETGKPAELRESAEAQEPLPAVLSTSSSE